MGRASGRAANYPGAVEEVLGLDREQTTCPRVLAQYGNMSSPTVLFILISSRTRGSTAALRGDRFRTRPRSEALLIGVIGRFRY